MDRIIEPDRISHPVDIANCLNTHFSSVGESMAEKIKTLDSDKDPIDYISCNVKHPANLSLTNEKEISDLVKSLKNKKACGYDLISNRILKETRKTIVPFITSLFNKCLSSGIFPESFKIAQVVPLFKGGDKENPTSYRPISLLPALGKLLEKLVSVRTLNFFNENDILSKHQFGFRKSFSTEFAILDIYEKLLCNLDKNVNSCAFFLDLAKAFDSVDHSILLRKLSRYGIDGAFFNFFKSYLENRSQFVKLDNVKSSILSIKYGVPQGSILGPLLFLIFINDLPNATNFFIKLFADDTFLCAQNADFQSLETEVNIEIHKVFQWLISNKLTLNIAKSKFMIISNSKSKPERFQISLNDSQLEECDKYKYLGVIIDKNLSWKPHVEYISGKISKACGALAKLRHCIGTNVLVEIYHALIHSYVRYGILTWGAATETTLKPLQTLLNKALRIITFAPFGRVDVEPLYKELFILDVGDTFILETCKFMYRFKKNLLPTDIAIYFTHPLSSKPKSSYNLRPRKTPSRIETRLRSSENSIHIRGELIWDYVPEVSRSSKSLQIFKQTIKNSLVKG